MQNHLYTHTELKLNTIASKCTKNQKSLFGSLLDQLKKTAPVKATRLHCAKSNACTFFNTYA